jgi:hypothetical protein
MTAFAEYTAVRKVDALVQALAEVRAGRGVTALALASPEPREGKRGGPDAGGSGGYRSPGSSVHTSP